MLASYWLRQNRCPTCIYSYPRCVVDAVIFALRDNGALVYDPQYGLKGPVYLESKDKEVLFYFPHFLYLKFYKMQVLFCGKLGPTWQRGVVTKRENFVKVETLEGTNMDRLSRMSKEK